jgi:mono/diheme cytochrome c family protein
MSRRPWSRSPIALLALLAAAAAAPARAADPPEAGGDPLRGRALFIGARRFQNGGSPCGACHAVGGQGGAFAAGMGPELSRSFEGMDPPTVDSLLEDLPFPSMMPVYQGHPLTPPERADLASFFGQVTGAPPPGALGVAGYAAALALACVGAMAAAARRRKGSTGARLVDRGPSPGRSGGMR